MKDEWRVGDKIKHKIIGRKSTITKVIHRIVESQDYDKGYRDWRENYINLSLIGRKAAQASKDKVTRGKDGKFCRKGSIKDQAKDWVEINPNQQEFTYGTGENGGNPIMFHLQDHEKRIKELEKLAYLFATTINRMESK